MVNIFVKQVKYVIYCEQGDDMKKYKDMRFTIIIGTMAALLFILTNYTMIVSKDFTRGAIGYVICVLAYLYLAIMSLLMIAIW